MDKDVPALYDAAMAEHSFVAVDNPVYDLVSVKKDEALWPLLLLPCSLS